MKTKICRDCRKRKPLTEYYRADDYADGRYTRCKAYCVEERRRRYLKSRERVLEQQRAYYAAHREEIYAAQKEYNKTHPEYARVYYRRNREKMLEYGGKCRAAKKAQSTGA